MPKMHDVVVREEYQRRRGIRADHALHIAVGLGNVFNHMGNVVIVGVPQFGELIPRTGLIALAPDPVLLRIGREHQRCTFLRPDETLVIV